MKRVYSLIALVLVLAESAVIAQTKGSVPIVASTLIAKGRHPRYTIGSVNLAEFFVSLASSLTFIASIGIGYFQIIAGLMLGGVIAAPIAANITRRIPVTKMMFIVGVVIMIVSLRLIINSVL